MSDDVQPVFGIDLGTTYTCISTVDEHGKPIVLRNAEDEFTTPSVVHFDGPNKWIVGSLAKQMANIDPLNTIQNVKRVMGDEHWVHTSHDKTYRPQEISAKIIDKIVSQAEKMHGVKIKDVVITCPAYFDLVQRQATKQAGELAGLNVLEVLTEPVAAAHAYDASEEQTILVYDLGGGTFDITVIKVGENGDLKALGISGDHQLGGKDWDERLVVLLAHEFENETGIDAETLLDDPEMTQKLIDEAERCKRALTHKEEQRVVLSHNSSGKSATITVTREEFEKRTKDLLDKTIALTKQELNRLKEELELDKIDKILLVGGSTFMPQVETRVAEEFGIEIVQDDPNLAVAKGAAIGALKIRMGQELRDLLDETIDTSGSSEDSASIRQSNEKEAKAKIAQKFGISARVPDSYFSSVTNVAPHSIGTISMFSLNENEDDDLEGVSNLIIRGEAIPIQTDWSHFVTYSDDDGVMIRVVTNLSSKRGNGLEGMVELEQIIDRVGEVELKFARVLPKGSPLRIQYGLTPDGLLTVKADESTTGATVEAEFKSPALLSSSELEASKIKLQTISTE